MFLTTTASHLHSTQADRPTIETPLAAMDGALAVAVPGVGLAAAAELLERGIPFVILEAGQHVGANPLG